jgi:O-antigen/teichoic acid export membrane protein
LLTRSSILTGLRASRFARHVALLMVGTGIAQVLSMAAAPVLTRLYAAPAFGVSGTLTAVTSVIVVVGSLCYESAIMLEADDRGARDVMRLSSLILAGMVALSLAGVGIGVGLGLGGAQFRDVAIIIPVSLALMGSQKICDQWLARSKKFGITSVAQVVRTCVTLVAQLAGGVAGLGWPGLVAGTLLGQAAGLAATAIAAGGILWAALRHCPSRGDLFIAARHHKRFMLYSVPQELLSTFSEAIPTILLTAWYGPAEAGFFFMANRIISIPTLVISGAVRPVYFRHAAEIAEEPAKSFRYFLQLTGILLACTLPVSLVLVIAGPQLFGLVLGQGWHHAGDYARWLSIPLAVFVVNLPAVTAIPILRLQGPYLVFQIFYSGLRLAALYGGAIAGTDLTAVAGYCLMTGLANLALVLYVGRYMLRRS